MCWTWEYIATAKWYWSEVGGYDAHCKESCRNWPYEAKSFNDFFFHSQTKHPQAHWNANMRINKKFISKLCDFFLFAVVAFDAVIVHSKFKLWMYIVYDGKLWQVRSNLLVWCVKLTDYECFQKQSTNNFTLHRNQTIIAQLIFKLYPFPWYYIVL